MAERWSVYIVDDDPSVRDGLAMMLSVHDYHVAVFGDAQSFLDALKPSWKGCALVDIRMPGIDGLALQKQLLDRASGLPVIMMTGHGDVASAREAFRALAVDFLEKPLDHKRLLAAVAEAVARSKAKVAEAAKRDSLQKLVASLTPREREVMERVVAGRHNREIAAELRISARTVEVHKARMMDKLGAGSVADLVRLCLQ